MSDNPDDTVQMTWGESDSNDADADAQANATGVDSLPLHRRMPLGETFDGDRDIYETLGYESDLTVSDYWNRYLRQDIARSIVDAPATTTWRELPEVDDDSDAEEATDFESDVQILFREHELQAKLEAVDRLAGIGHFGVLVIGFKDGGDLAEPVNRGALSGPDDLAYLMPIAEDRVEDWHLNSDDQDERFGLPEWYTIDFSNRERLGGTIFDTTVDTRTVHHERVIHVPASNTLDNVLFGRPRLEAVYNRLEDIEKVVGSSAEAMWRVADYGLALQGDPEHTGHMNQADYDRLEQELQAWYHDLQPFLRLSGFEVEKLEGSDPNPTGIFDALIKLIAGETGIPQRILTGSERGELASTQDRASWLGRISERQTNFAEPKIFRPLLDLLAEYGVIAEPSGGETPADPAYEVDWPNLFELSDGEKAEITAQKAQALSNARTTSSNERIMTPGEIRSEIFDMDPELGSEVDIDEDLPEDDADDLLSELLPGDEPPEPPDPTDDGTDGDPPEAPDDEPDDDNDMPPDANTGVAGFVADDDD